MELKDLIKAALSASNSAAVSLKDAAANTKGYSAFDQTYFKDNMVINISEDLSKWIPYSNGQGYYTLMSGIDPELNEEVPVNVGFKTIFRRVSTVDDNGIVQKGLIQNEGNFQEYRHKAATLDAFWESVKGKKMTISKVRDVKTPVYDPGFRYHAGDEVPADKITSVTIWQIDIE